MTKRHLVEDDIAKLDKLMEITEEILTRHMGLLQELKQIRAFKSALLEKPAEEA